MFQSLNFIKTPWKVLKVTRHKHHFLKVFMKLTHPVVAHRDKRKIQGLHNNNKAGYDPHECKKMPQMNTKRGKMDK